MALAQSGFYASISCSISPSLFRIIIYLPPLQNFTTPSTYTEESETWRLPLSPQEFLPPLDLTVGQNYPRIVSAYSTCTPTNPSFQAPYLYDVKSVICSRAILCNGISSASGCVLFKLWMRVISCLSIKSLVRSPPSPTSF